MAHRAQRSPAEIREDEVVERLLISLRARDVSAALHERPDRLPPQRRTFTKVTSDALITVGSEEGTLDWWACDVMALSAPFSHAQVLEYLDDELNVLATRRCFEIHLEGSFSSSGMDQARDQDTAALNEAKAVVAAIAEGVTRNSEHSVKVGEFTARWKLASKEPTVNLVVGLPSRTADLAQQMADTLRQPLRKKATKQGLRAREAGCSVAVMLDWAGHEGIRQGTHWLAMSPQTVSFAVNDVLTGIDSAIDAVLMLDRKDDWHLLRGVFPGFGADPMEKN